MNGFKLMAETYKEVLNKDRSSMQEADIKRMERCIYLYDFLGDLKEDDDCILFDSSYFNDIFKGYIKLMMDELVEDEDEEIAKAAEILKDRMNGKAYAILDRYKAKQAKERG